MIRVRTATAVAIAYLLFPTAAIAALAAGARSSRIAPFASFAIGATYVTFAMTHLRKPS